MTGPSPDIYATWYRTFPYLLPASFSAFYKYHKFINQAVYFLHIFKRGSGYYYPHIYLFWHFLGILPAILHPLLPRISHTWHILVKTAANTTRKEAFQSNTHFSLAKDLSPPDQKKPVSLVQEFLKDKGSPKLYSLIYSFMNKFFIYALFIYSLAQ